MVDKTNIKSRRKLKRLCQPPIFVYKQVDADEKILKERVERAFDFLFELTLKKYEKINNR